MSAYLGENIRMDLGVLAIGGAVGVASAQSTAGVFSKAYSLADVDRIMIMCGQGEATGVAVNSATFTVVVGTYTAQGGSAMTVLTGATLKLGITSVSSFDGSGMIEARIHADATAALTPGDVYFIDNSCIVLAAAGSVTDNTISTGNIAFMNDLVSWIATRTTHLELARTVTATTDTQTFIRQKDFGFAGPMGTGLGGRSTVTNATTGEMEWLGLKYQGVIEITPADVLATAASYTHFAVKLNTTVTTAPFTAVVIRTGGRNATQTKRTQL